MNFNRLGFLIKISKNPNRGEKKQPVAEWDKKYEEIVVFISVPVIQ